jgi:hypothetical protein
LFAEAQELQIRAELAEVRHLQLEHFEIPPRIQRDAINVCILVEDQLTVSQGRRYECVAGAAGFDPLWRNRRAVA